MHVTLLAACLRVRLGALERQARADTHLLASSIAFSVSFIVSFVFVSIIVIMSLRTVTTSVVDGMHNGQCMCLARSGGGKRIAERVRAGCASGEPADGQPVASASSITSSF